MKKYLLPLCVFLLWCAPVQATTFYVAKGTDGGNDSNTCIQASTGTPSTTPKLTISAGLACLKLGAPGDSLLIRTGTYAERITTSQLRSGSSAALPITISNYNSELVTLQPTGAGNVLDIVANVGTLPYQYITFNGLVMDAGSTTNNFVVNLDGITVGSSNIHHIRFTNSEFKGAKKSGHLYGRGANFIEVRDSLIHNNGTDITQDHGIYAQAKDCLFIGSRFYANSGSGLQVYTGFAGDSADRNVISRNVFYGNHYGFIMKSGANNSADHNIVYGNVTSGTGNGITIGSGAATSTGAKLYHNTVYGNSLQGIILGNPGAHTGTILTNNIVYGNGTQIENNCPACATLTTNQTTDPSFISPGIVAGSDFGLQAGSSAINAGSAIAGFSPNGTPDIGAHETITFATGKILNVSPFKTMELTFLNNNAAPLLPAGATCAGFLPTKGAGLTPNTIVTCTRTGQNVISLLLTTAYANGDIANFTYTTAGGNVTDSALIGNLKNQRLNAISSVTGTVSTSEISSGSPPALSQASYRFESFGGPETAPNYTKALNTSITLPPNACTRVRGQISNTTADFGAAGYAPYAQRNGAGGYVVVSNGPCTSTGICFVSGTGIALPELMAGATTEQLAGSGSFMAGGVQTNSAETPNITLATGQDTELVAALCVGAGNSAGDYFDIHWCRAGVALNTYPQTPRITIGGYTAQQGAR